MSHILFENRSRGVLLHSDFGCKNSVFEQVRALRRHAGNKFDKIPCDDYSSHYLLVAKSSPVGAISLTALRDGPIDCLSAYPPKIISEFGDVIEAAHSFAILGDRRSAFHSLIRMIRATCRVRLETGIRLQMVNATGGLVSRYESLGYFPLSSWAFTHDRLGTPSIPMFLPADPTRDSVCRRQFQQIEQPLPIDEVLSCLPSTHFYGGAL